MLPALFFEFLGRWHRANCRSNTRIRAWTGRRARLFSPRPVRCSRSPRSDPVGPARPATRQLLDALRSQHRVVQAFVKALAVAEQLKGSTRSSRARAVASGSL